MVFNKLPPTKNKKTFVFLKNNYKLCTQVNVKNICYEKNYITSLDDSCWNNIS